MKEPLLDPKNWIDPTTGQRYRYFSPDGVGYSDVLKWANDFEEGKKKRIVQQSYAFFGMLWVSTVWIGLDHSWNNTGPPLIFETMVFPRFPFTIKQRWADLDMARYTTKTQSVEGHKAMVKKWSNPLQVIAVCFGS